MITLREKIYLEFIQIKFFVIKKLKIDALQIQKVNFITLTMTIYL